MRSIACQPVPCTLPVSLRMTEIAYHGCMSAKQKSLFSPRSARLCVPPKGGTLALRGETPPRPPRAPRRVEHAPRLRGG